jgi:hypothetical protein
LYSYSNAPFAKWNNWIIGAVIFALAVYQDWRDEMSKPNGQRRSSA